jgi:hypothetical protein
MPLTQSFPVVGWIALLAGVFVAAQSLFAIAAVSTEPGTGAGTEKPPYAQIYEKNIFDPNRHPWAEKPAQPAVPALNPADLLLYGVINVGSFRKAVLKPGPSLKAYVPDTGNKRPFVTLAEGEALGPYTLAEIGQNSVVFEAGGARYTLTFGEKGDRPAAAPAAPVIQGPVVLAPEVPNVIPGITPVAEAAPATPVPAAPAPVQQAQVQETPAQASAPTTSQPTTAPTAPQAPVIQGRTLLEAIQAARQAQQQGLLPATPQNPFGPRN